MRGDAHVRFGGRAEETDRPKDRHRASARPLHSVVEVVAEELGSSLRWATAAPPRQDRQSVAVRLVGEPG